MNARYVGDTITELPYPVIARDFWGDLYTVHGYGGVHADVEDEWGDRQYLPVELLAELEPIDEWVANLKSVFAYDGGRLADAVVLFGALLRQVQDNVRGQEARAEAEFLRSQPEYQGDADVGPANWREDGF